MNKQTDTAFGKEVYLLGKDADGINYWLEAPKWDCGWYWAFGYIETYQSNREPHLARDIDSHQHADGEYRAENSTVTGKPNYNYDTNLFSGDFLVEKTFSEAEGWKLRELMATFYQLKKQAELTGRGGMHVTTNPLSELLQDAGQTKHINEVLIPAVTKAVTDTLEATE